VLRYSSIFHHAYAYAHLTTQPSPACARRRPGSCLARCALYADQRRPRISTVVIAERVVRPAADTARSPAYPRAGQRGGRARTDCVQDVLLCQRTSMSPALFQSALARNSLRDPAAPHPGDSAVGPVHPNMHRVSRMADVPCGSNFVGGGPGGNPMARPARANLTRRPGRGSSRLSWIRLLMVLRAHNRARCCVGRPPKPSNEHRLEARTRWPCRSSLTGSGPPAHISSRGIPGVCKPAGYRAHAQLFVGDLPLGPICGN